MTETIRPATFDDAPAMAHVHVEAWRTAYREIMSADFLKGLSKDDRRQKWKAILTKDTPREFNIVAEHDGEIVGFASGGPERKNAPAFAGELYAIYLLEQFRRQGIGTKLFQKSVEMFLELGMESMKVRVLRENPYRGFYDRLGGMLLNETAAIAIGGVEMEEVAYGWTSLKK